MQSIIVFILYFIFISWVLTCVPFIKNTGINKWGLVLLFTIKIFAGIIYGWFYLQPSYNATSDTWHFFELSKTETDWLLNDPLAFFKDIFTYGYDRSGNLFLGDNSYWNDLKSNIIVKLLAISNVFTFKNYYADIIFFNFLFFFGPVAVYKIVLQLFHPNKVILVISIFLIPSFLFWCSGIHKDGLIFSCIGIIIYHFQKQLLQHKIILQSSVIAIFCFIILFALRNFMALLLIPALLVWLLSNLNPKKSKIITINIYMLGIIIFFALPEIIPQINPPTYIVEKQSEFKELQGDSQIPVPSLESNFVSFIKFFPTAVDIAFFRPHVTEIYNKSYIPAVTEILLLWFIILFFLLFQRNTILTSQQSAYLLFCICFSLSFLLIAGYTITFSGAIVRYRAVVLPFIVIPVLSKIPIKPNKKASRRL